MGVDYDARLLAYKILIIVFIIITIIVNAEYLFKYLRALKVLYRAGHLGKITLAIGNIFLALFSYVIFAKLYFEDSSDLSCRTLLSATVFIMHFFPFVVGFMISSACLNIYLSQRQFRFFKNTKMMSLLMNVFPWQLALLVVCPLAFSGTDWKHSCAQNFSLERRRANFGICILLPAIVAILFSIVLNYMTSTSSQQPFTALVESIPNAYATNASANTNMAMSDFQPTQLQCGALETTQCPPWYPQSEQGVPQYTQQYPQQQCPQYNLPPNAQQNSQHHSQVIQAPSYSGSGPLTTDPAASNYLTLQQLTMEKRGLLWASVIFFCSVVPHALFTLGYTLNDDEHVKTNVDEMTISIINDICFWMFYLYPVFLPIVWRSQVQT